jgi:hypothetical protein
MVLPLLLRNFNEVFELSMQTIQVGAARVLSELLIVADYLQQYSFGNACFGLDDKQVLHVVFELILLLSSIGYCIKLTD